MTTTIVFSFFLRTSATQYSMYVVTQCDRNTVDKTKYIVINFHPTSLYPYTMDDDAI